MLASTIQFTTNPPTPTPHHPSNRQQKHGPGNQGALPQNPDSMPPPTHAGGTHHHPTGQQRACFLHHTQPTTPTAQNRRNQPAMHSNLRARHPSTGRPGPHWPRQDKQPKIRRRQTAPHKHSILRKEVIQPHLPVRLPCYDFVPITSPTFDRSP